MRILNLNGKCSDLCYAEYSVDGKIVAKSDGYVPDIKGIGGGDYIEMDIDLDTGQILNWKPSTHQEVMEAVKGYDDSDEDEDPEGEGRYQDEDGNWVGPTKTVLDASINKMLDELDFKDDIL